MVFSYTVIDPAVFFRLCTFLRKENQRRLNRETGISIPPPFYQDEGGCVAGGMMDESKSLGLEAKLSHGIHHFPKAFWAIGEKTSSAAAAQPGSNTTELRKTAASLFTRNGTAAVRGAHSASKGKVRRIRNHKVIFPAPP